LLVHFVLPLFICIVLLSRGRVAKRAVFPSSRSRLQKGTIPVTKPTAIRVVLEKTLELTGMNAISHPYHQYA